MTICHKYNIIENKGRCFCNIQNMKIHKYLENIDFFKEIPKKELKELSKNLKFKELDYSMGDTVLNQGDEGGIIAVLLSGKCRIIQKTNDEAENQQELNANEIFPPELSCTANNKIAATLQAVQYSKFLFIYLDAITKKLLSYMYSRNRASEERLLHLTKKSTRDKLLSFIQAEAAKAGKNQFSISMNRQQLADYLCVERSAMCLQLSNLQRDGIIIYDKNNFTLNKNSNE